ncbi:MAG: hypothetical protein ACE149_05780 [Armatimonadota bacterium]
MSGRTHIGVEDEAFTINGAPTYAGRSYRGVRVEGLLPNSRMVQAIFDDLNPETRSMWAYPDTGVWDAERNVSEFIAALPSYRQAGLLAFTVNLQGGMPTPHTEEHQPWHNSGWTAEGELRPEYEDRLRRVVERADELGMAVILGLFYFGQDERLADERAIRRAVESGAGWVLEEGFTNVLLEINNECNILYDHEVLQPHRVHELIEVAKQVTRDGRRLLVSTSYGGGTVPGEKVCAASDFVLLHGNGVDDPARIAAMVRETRALKSYRPMPIVFNEDDHYGFDRPSNNMLAALSEHASWGYYDQGTNNYRDGYQSPPTNWGINTERKKGFFELVHRLTGAAG